MNAVSGLNLISGPLPAILLAASAVALLVLLLRRKRRWVLLVVVAVAVSAGLALLANWFVVNVVGLSAYELPRLVTVWIGVGFLAILLVAANVRCGPLWRRILAPVAALLIVLTAAAQINVYFGQYRTLGDLTGASTASISPLAVPPSPTAAGVLATAGAPIVSRWVQPAGMPSTGAVHSVQIPGPVSGFAPSTAYVYLPAAYHTSPPPLLPVLVLIAGQPGSPLDWLISGQLKSTMDAFAAAHHGLAPVVVVPDVNGSPTGNTMCMDSQIAKADTYLSVDVPAWIKSTLKVDPRPAHWAIGGFSFGGTCAIQMAALHPRIYPSAIDLSGEAEPALSADRATTIQAAFGGNTAAFNALTPLTVLATTKYPNSWVYFSVGGQDSLFTGYMHQVSAAAKAAGMHVTEHSVPGVGHSWSVPVHALTPALGWLSHRLGLAL